MDRPGFTVEVDGGINYDANHLTICWSKGRWIVSFICSGVLENVSINLIKEIRFSKKGVTYCNECDGQIPTRI